MKIKSRALALIILVVVFGGVALSSALGWWATSGGNTIAVYKDGEFTGTADPSAIKGSSTFALISDTFGIPLEDLGAAFGFETGPEELALIKCKALEAKFTSVATSDTEVGTSSMQLFAALYKGLPYEPDPGVALPEPAITLLKEKIGLTDKQLSAIPVLPLPQPGASGAVTSSSEPAASATTTSEESAYKIKGTTTFAELISWGVAKADIEKALDGEMPNPLTGIKDHCSAKGLDFGTVKTALKVLVDAATASK